MNTRIKCYISLSIATLLLASGCKDNVIVDGGSYSGTWKQIASMNVARREHSMVSLPDGRVLVSGGNAFDGRIGTGIHSCEIYNPLTGLWVMTDSLAIDMWRHKSILLDNGKVLVIEGEGQMYCQLYDPTTGQWSHANASSVEREEITATLLKNGKVLVTGGRANAPSELYDPSSGTWSPTGILLVQHSGHTATLLKTGNVLIVGGFDSSGHMVRECEIYDPLTGSWSRTDSTLLPRGRHTATLLGSGKVLVTGGFDPIDNTGELKSCEVYDPNSRKWTLVAPMSTGKAFHTAVPLTNGNVIVLPEYDWGGEIYTEHSNTWTHSQPMTQQRGWIAATVLPGGLILATGGLYYSQSESHDVTISNADIYTP